MKKKIESQPNELDAMKSNKMSRKEVIQKTGMAVVSAAAMMLLLGSSNNAQAASPPGPTPW